MAGLPSSDLALGAPQEADGARIVYFPKLTDATVGYLSWPDETRSREAAL